MKKYENLSNLLLGLTEYFLFNNEVRLHEIMNYERQARHTKMLQTVAHKLWLNLAGTKGNPPRKNWGAPISCSNNRG